MAVAIERAGSHMEPVATSSNRSFGLVIAGVFALIALWPLWHGNPVRIWAAIVAGSFGAAALIAPVLLTWFNKAWTAFGLILFRIITPINMGILFYLVVTPVGLLMQLTGADPLRLKRDPKLTDYWVRRTPPGPEPDSLRNQF